MALIKRDHHRQDDNWLAPFQDEVHQMFERFFSDDGFFTQKRSFVPAIDIKEKSKKYVVEVEVPGLEPDDIEIEMNGNLLTLKGEKRMEETTEDEETHRVERKYGAFRRSFTLPDDANMDDIKAKTRHGVLYIHIPKLKERKVKKIKINGLTS
ncbi:MAG: Hsp20/alpha crystallin family protein [Bacillaceae bacterium]|nr:Hsp20/alpha crystallin family protein [Bacillaceae bacterium]